jgi:hypothetical protein
MSSYLILTVMQASVKRQLSCHPEMLPRRAYNIELNQIPVAEAALAQPFDAMERSLQRHKVVNRPPLPNHRQHWILQPVHTMTRDGRRLLLIDDGAADRIVVFATDDNLRRFVVVCATVFNEHFFAMYLLLQR